MELNRQNVTNMYHTYYAKERERLHMSESDGHVTDEKLEEVYLKCVAVDDDGFDWLDELNEIASADAKDDGDYNFWDDIRERRD
jgi:hypothetical protein